MNDGQTDSIDRDRAFFRHLSEEGCGCCEVEESPRAFLLFLDDGSNGIDVSRHEVSSKPIAGPQGSLAVDLASEGHAGKPRPGQGFRSEFKGALGPIDGDDGKAAAR